MTEKALAKTHSKIEACQKLPISMKKHTQKAKENLFRLSDPDSYTDVVSECMNDKEKERMPAEHIANIMALTADMIFSHIDSISEAFELNNGLEITFKAKLAKEKDTVHIQFKPVGEMKDSASATVADPDQNQFNFKKDEEAKKDDDDLDIQPKALPAPKAKEPLTLEVVGGEENE